MLVVLVTPLACFSLRVPTAGLTLALWNRQTWRREVYHLHGLTEDGLLSYRLVA